MKTLDPLVMSLSVASKKKLSFAIVGVAMIGTWAAVALGSPGVGFHPESLVTGNIPGDIKLNSDRVKFQTKGPVDVRVQRIVIDPGGYSGWHHHPGMVIASVLSGQVTFTNSDCSSTTYGPAFPPAPYSSSTAMIRGRPRAPVGRRSMRRLCAARQSARLPGGGPRSVLPVMTGGCQGR